MSGLIPQHFIDDLIARADVVEIIGKRVPLKKAGREFKANCPFHDEKTPSFTVSPTKGFYHCFGCGAHGTALGFLMEFEHLSFVEAVESLAASMGIEVPREQGQRPARRYDELFELLQGVEHHYQDGLKTSDVAKSYLQGRGIDGATAKRFGVGYAPPGWSVVLDRFGTSEETIQRLLATGLIIRKEHSGYYDRFRDRIMFPIRDARGRCIGFGGRVLNDDEPKYLNSPETALFHKGRELYGLFEARQAIRNIARIVVVEGYMDVLSLQRNGIEYAVATLGTATTDNHFNRLFRLTDEVVFCFDGDAAGRAAAWRALETALPEIRDGRQIRFVFLPEGQDPDSFVRQQGGTAFERALDHGLPLSDFLIAELAGQVDLQSVDGRARLAEIAKPLVQRIPRGVYRELLIERLSETVGLPASKLQAIVSDEHKSGAVRQSTRGLGGVPRTASRSGARQPSVVRRAITLLLNHPEAARRLDGSKLAGVTKPGTQLLRELIELLNAEPDMTTAGILERWRHRDEGRHLGKLATVELPDDADFDAIAELEHSLDQLAAFKQRERVNNLIEKERLSSLTDAERAELRQHRRSPEMPG